MCDYRFFMKGLLSLVLGAAPVLSFSSLADGWTGWPSEGGDVVLPAGETIKVFDADAEGIAKTTSITFEDGATLVFTNITTTIFLNGRFTNKTGVATVRYTGTKPVVINADNTGWTGSKCLECASSVIVSNRYGLGTSATPMVRVDPMANLWFGGNGLTNDVPLAIDYSGDNRVLNRRYQQDPVYGPFVQNGRFVDEYSARYGDTIINGSWSVNASSGTQRVDEGRRLYINGPWSYAGLFRIAGPGAVHINHQATSAVGTLYYDTYGGIPAPTYVFGVENALKGAAKWNLCTGATVDLAGYDQSCAYLTSPNASRDKSGSPLSIRSSSGPATLTITGNDVTEYSRPARFEGWLSLTYSRAGKQKLTKWKSTASGELNVTSGTLEFADGAGWGGASVIVSGGTLLLSSADPLPSSNAVVTVDGGTLEVAEGVTAVMRRLVCGEKILETQGVYGIAALTESGFAGLSGGGSIRIVDVRPVLSLMLDPEGSVTVTQISGGIGAEGLKVVIPEGEELFLDWTSSGLATTRYEFKAEIVTGELKIYSGEDLVKTVSSSGTYDITSADALSLRFVSAGEGVSIHGFTNRSKVTIAAADNGISVSGGVIGDNLVPAGGTLSITVDRVFDSATLTTGVSVNGVVYDFAEYPSGIDLSFSDADRGADVTIEAIYEEDTKAYYVDPANGSDNNKGYHVACPVKSPQTVLDIASDGSTVYLLPGVYSNGTTRVASEKTLTRIYVPSGVDLVGLGRKEQIIVMGAEAPEENQTAGCYGCGEGAVRCIYLYGPSTVRNMTISGGRTYVDAPQASDTADEDAGGIYIYQGGGTVIDCIITNCVANCRGAIRANGATLINTRICYSRAIWHSVIGMCNLYGCVIDHVSGAYLISASTTRKIVNTTIGPGNSTTKILEGPYDVYNTILHGGINSDWGGSLYRTYFAGGYLPETLPTTEGKLNDGCKSHDDDGIDIVLDGAFMPVKGECSSIDAGADYSSLYPEGYEDWAKIDLYGNRRVSNGTIDVGAVEYDWRADYAAAVYRRFTCESASSAVVENEGRVRLPGGTSVVFGWQAGARVSPLLLPVAVSGGTLEIKVNGAVIASLTSDAQWKYDNPLATDVIEFEYSGTGFAELAAGRSTVGLQLIVR